MKNLLLILSLLISGCATTVQAPVIRSVEERDPQKVKEQTDKMTQVVPKDLFIRNQTPRADQIMFVINAVEFFLEEELDEDWEFIFVDRPILMNGGKEGYVSMADGVTDPRTKKIVIFAWQKCLAKSALIHEIVHALGFPHSEQAEKVIYTIEGTLMQSKCPGYDPTEEPVIPLSIPIQDMEEGPDLLYRMVPDSSSSYSL